MTKIMTVKVPELPLLSTYMPVSIFSIHSLMNICEIGIINPFSHFTDGQTEAGGIKQAAWAPASIR